MTNPFDPAVVSAETAAFNARLLAELKPLPPVNTVPPELTRKARSEGRGVFPLAGPLDSAEWCNIPGAPGGPARVRVTRPDAAPRGTYLHIHGGGWTLGTPDQYDGYNLRIAKATGCEVVSAEYRLSPESRWPGCADDCEAAALWALDARSGPLIIGGESAGAHLTAVTLVRLKARGMLSRVAGAVLNYGIYDLALTPSARNWGEEYLILSTPVIDWFSENLLADRPRRDPAVSPLWSDLAGMPPGLFQVGTSDPLLDDSLFMAARWRAAGGVADLAVYPGGVHAFDMFDLEIARQSHARQDTFVNGCLDRFRQSG